MYLSTISKSLTKTMLYAMTISTLLPCYSWSMFHRESGATYEIDIEVANAPAAGTASITPYVIDPSGVTTAQDPISLTGGSSEIITFTFEDPRQGDYRILLLVRGTSSTDDSVVSISGTNTMQKWTFPGAMTSINIKYPSPIIDAETVTLALDERGILALKGHYTASDSITPP